MSVQVEKLEHNMVKLTIEVPAEQFAKACKAAYNKQKNSFSVPGFRKGKVPMNMVEKMYGPQVFFDDAANTVMNETYGPALDEAGITPVSQPTADIVSIGKGEVMVYTVEVAVKPEITLGQYKGIEVTALSAEATEEEVDAKIAEEQKKQARKESVTDRAVADGDKIKLNYAGTVDGVAFDGGTAENQDLVIGSGSFIPGFEDQLIGVMPGTDVNVNVTFPEDYQAAELAGKAAVFACKVLSIETEELPELDDEFAQEVSEYDTFEEYKASVKTQVEEQKARENKNTQTQEAIDKIIAAVEWDIPEAMIASEGDSMIDEFKQQISQSGLTFEQYLQFSGSTEDALKEQVKPEAENRIKTSLVLEKIAEVENIEVSDEDVEAEIARMAAQYGMEVEKLKSYMGDAEKASMKREMAPSKAADLIFANVVAVEAPAAEE